MKEESKARPSDEDLGKLVRKTFSDSARRHFTTTFGVYNGKQSWVAEWKDLNSWEKQVHIEIARAIKKALESQPSTEKALKEVREFVKIREDFGITTAIQNRSHPEDGIKGNKTGEAYGEGYSEAARNILDYLDKLLTDAEREERKE